jgi:hypothetical protein
MKKTQTHDELQFRNNVVVEDGSKSFDEFVNSRAEMAKDKERLIPAEELFKKLRSKVGKLSV